MQLFSTGMIFFLLSVTRLKKKQEKKHKRKNDKEFCQQTKSWHVCIFSIILVLCAPCWLTWLLTEIQFEPISSTMGLYVSLFSSHFIKAVINARGRNQLKSLSVAPCVASVCCYYRCVCDQRQIQFFHFTSVIVSTAFHSSINTINPCILILWLP